MKLKELRELLARYDNPRQDDLEVVISCKLPYPTIGRRPSTPLKSAYAGFDWEKGQFILCPEETLTKLEKKK